MNYNVISAIITVAIGLPGIAGFVWWCINQKRKKRKEKFKKIGISESGYKELYDFLFEYHSINLKNTKQQYNLVEFNYFKNIFGDRVKLRKDKALYRFPLLYKANWVRSYNEELCIELDELIDSCKDNHLRPLSDNFLKRFGISDYINFLKNECEKKVWKQTTFDLYKIKEKGNTLVLSCCKGNYINFVNTYELIQKELYYNYIHKENKFILRKKINFDYLDDYSWRPAKIGISVFTIMKRKDGGYSTFIHKRKSHQLEYPELYCVAPAGTFQPVSGGHNIENQYSFGFTIFREFLEELFDLEKADGEYKESGSMNIFSLIVERKEKGLSPICPGKLLFGEKLDVNKFETDKLDVNKFKTGKYELIPTSFSIDLTSFKPEITFILFIKDETIHEALSEYISGCWEADIGEYDLTGNYCDYCDGNFFKFLGKHLDVSKFTPVGAIAVSEGIKWYMENL